MAVTKKPKGPEAELTLAIGELWQDPLGHVMFSYPWDTDPSIQLVKLPPKYRDLYQCEYGPDAWACDFLDDWAVEIRIRGFDGRNPVPPIQFSTVSGHGIGKSTLTSWIIKFIMDTRPFAKGTVTANTADQLKAKTWAELGKWHSRSVTQHWFDYTNARGSMQFKHREYPNEWFCNAYTCREENSESFAGQHAANSTSFYVFDEASSIPSKIWEVRQGGLVRGEPMTFDFGNGTRNSGYFFDNCVGRYSHRYLTRSIDSRDTAVATLSGDNTLHRQWAEDYGEDSDFFKVRVKGQFPSAGDLQFIPTGWVNEAMLRPQTAPLWSPGNGGRYKLDVAAEGQLLIGVDVARFGGDESVIYPRIGMDARSFPAKRFRGLDTVSLVGQVVETIREFKNLGKKCAGLFIDGGGIGGAVVDMLRNANYNPIEVQFGGGATNKATYRFKGDETWGNMKDAIQHRLLLPPLNSQLGSDLHRQLTQREFGYTLQGHKIHLESKDDLKKRLGEDASPDVADALACTFAFEVAPLPEEVAATTMTGAGSDYDPLTIQM